MKCLYSLYQGSNILGEIGPLYAVMLDCGLVRMKDFYCILL